MGPPLLDGWKNPGVQCLPGADNHLGLVDALDVAESKSVVISAFSNMYRRRTANLIPPWQLRFRASDARLRATRKSCGSMSAQRRIMTAVSATDA
jgi:hypothetical protein